jgi:ferredoxin
MPKVILLPQQVTIEIPGEDTLLRELKAKGVAIKSSCGGHATCADCVVKIVRGQEHLTPSPFEELRLLGNVFHLTKERLCCQTKVNGEVVIDISGHAVGDLKNLVPSSHEEKVVTAAPVAVVRKKSPSVTNNITNNSGESTKENRPPKPRKGGFWRPKLSKLGKK